MSTRTVLRDIEALSAAGVPVYAERGRRGGFALLPGFRTELTGLNHDEALALLVAGSRRGAQVFGLGSALASAMLKVVDALPESYRATAGDAARRLLIDPETDLLSRRLVAEEVPDSIATEVRRAVFAGHKLRIHYAAVDQAPTWRTVDPIGLVTVHGQGYLLATRSGADRTYRLSRVLAAEELAEPAQRPERVDLDRAWQERSTRFRLGGEQVTVLMRVTPPGAGTWPARRWPSEPRKPMQTDGCGSRRRSRTHDTPSGRCGSSARTRKPWPRSGCAPRSATAPPRWPPATETHPEGQPASVPAAPGVRTR